MAIARVRDDNGMPFKTYERGWSVGRMEVSSVNNHIWLVRCTVLQQQLLTTWLETQEDGRAFLHNHLRFTILYHGDAETGLARIVGFEVEPFSVKHKYDGKWDPEKPELKTCNPSSMKFVTEKDAKQEVKENEEIIFTYDVYFKASSGKAPDVMFILLGSL